MTSNPPQLFAGLIARVSNVEEVRVVCSSTGVFVAALEGFLRHRLDDILRNPTSPAEQAYNNTRVVRPSAVARFNPSTVQDVWHIVACRR